MGAAALAINGRYADLNYLKENLWGEKLLKDTKTFLETPKMKDVILHLEPSSPTE